MINGTWLAVVILKVRYYIDFMIDTTYIAIAEGFYM